MKVYLTKYALEEGVTEYEITESEWEESIWDVYLIPKSSFHGRFHGRFFTKGKDVTDSLEEAEAIFNQMKEKKIKSMEKKLAAVKAKTFKVKKV